MLTTIPMSELRLFPVGKSIHYSNNYGQHFVGKVMTKHLTDDGRIFIGIKRPEWAQTEQLALSDFANGTYQAYA